MSSQRTAISSLLSFCYITRISAAYEPWLNHFDHHTDLEEDDYALYWTPHTENCSIEFGVEVKTSGWAGLGLSGTGNMFPADIVIGWVDQNEVYLHNYYTIAKSQPILFNDQSGITLIEGWQEDIDGTPTTYLHFEKELFAEEFRDDGQNINIGTTKVIYAFNQNNPSENNPRALVAHPYSADRGTKSLNLLSGETEALELPEDIHAIDVLQPNVEVPDTDTTYMCTLLELPPFEAVEHIMRIDPVVQEGNEALVHHLLLYACPERYVDLDYVGTGWNCKDAPNMATNLTHCRLGNIIYAWAVGGGNFYFPQDVGMPIGSDDAKYVLLETHFDNPREESGHLDESGLRLWVTPTLRTQEAAILTVMDALDQFVPPGVTSVWNYAYLTGDCSVNGFPEEGVHVFANLYHQHVLGRAGIIRHIRNGTELAPIEVNKAYDFDFQQYVPLAEHRLLLPGDEIVVECNLDSSEREFMTYGGESTREEMCVTFFAVYPKPRLAIAQTSFHAEEKEQFFADALENGYWNEEKDTLDVSVDGALQFYTDFINDPNRERRAICQDSDQESLVPEGFDIVLPVSGYEVYDEDDYFGCVVAAESSESSGFEWNSWYVYLGGIVIGLLVVGLVVCVAIKCLWNKKTGSTNHHRQLVEVGTNDDGVYGATEGDENNKV